MRKPVKNNSIDFYVVRIGYNNDFANSQPCSQCTAALKFAGIRRIYYTNNNGEIECQKVCNIENTHLSYSQKEGKAGVQSCCNNWKF